MRCDDNNACVTLVYIVYDGGILNCEPAARVISSVKCGH